ncbi:MAG: TfoX/Sxy family protein [Bacteroidota bacterium]
MAYSEFQADRIRTRLTGIPFVEKKMMGGLIFMVNDAMCVGLDIEKTTRKDRLMVRVGKLNYEDLLNRNGSRPMDFTGSHMNGFLFVNLSGFDNEYDLDFWIAKALEFNQYLIKK